MAKHVKSASEASRVVDWGGGEGVGAPSSSSLPRFSRSLHWPIFFASLPPPPPPPPHFGGLPQAIITYALDLK